MKAKVITLAIALTTITAPVNADVYVPVDADGNAVGGAIVCDAATCGAGSLYSQLTLKEGQRYVLQSAGQAGIGNNTPNTNVSVNQTTNEWTVTTPQSETKFTPDKAPWTQPVQVVSTPTVIETSTATAVTDTSTVTTDTTTVTVDSAKLTTNSSKDEIVQTINALIAKITALLSLLGIK